MGGVFSSPKIKEPIVQDNSNADKKAEEERLKLQARQRRNMDSTIKTSYNGVLNADQMNRKKLLGE